MPDDFDMLIYITHIKLMNNIECTAQGHIKSHVILIRNYLIKTLRMLKLQREFDRFGSNEVIKLQKRKQEVCYTAAYIE